MLRSLLHYRLLFMWWFIRHSS